MTKRIVSGIFILTALGALGVILAGALTSGEQLIVRFLTAVIVAALGLYVISDLRLQADDDAAGLRPGGRPRLAGIDAPPNSTAAFMATVTGRGESPSRDDLDEISLDEQAGDVSIEPHEPVVGAASSSTSEREASAVVEDAGSPDGPPVPTPVGPAPVTIRAADLPGTAKSKPATITDLFARRPDEVSEQDWPTVADPSHQAAADVASPVPPAQPPVGDGIDVGSSDEIWSDAGEVVIETPVVDVSADFEYSGDLEGPNEPWPAVPVAPTEEATEPTTHASDGSPVTADGPDTPIRDDLVITSVDVDHTPDHSRAPATADAISTISEGDADTDPRSGEEPGDEASADLDVDEGTSAPESGPLHEAEPVDGAAVNGVRPSSTSPLITRAESGVADYADAPLAPIIDLRDVNATGTGIDDAIRRGELEVVAALIEQGMLSTEGPISDRDVRTMVYVAFTSNELRKLLLAGGAPGRPNPEIDLGPVELFDGDSDRVPKTIYPGPPSLPAEARSQLG